ncbi:MAG: hypothetical protein J3R72DRAFT_475868 [Linnemannia gamsii]|nr:MAG: hypothetical protein J3R72DRAFT_475868 [Linnemannia gamsii]
MLDSKHRPLRHHIVVIAACLALVTLPASAIANSPAPVHSMAFATAENTLYIKGGRTSDGGVVNQFYALDLTLASWETTNPPWKELSNASANNNSVAVFPSYQALSASQDQLYLTVWTLDGSKSDYSIRNDAWTPVSRAFTSSKGSLGAYNGLQVVTDPTTGLVYIPRGQKNNMLVFNPTNNTTTTVLMPQILEYPDWTHYSFVWSQSTRNFFLFGGGGKTIHDLSSTTYFWEYSPPTKSWTIQQSSGSIPGPSTSSCMVSAHNGTKIIRFGGRRGDTLLGSLHILDLRTRIWTQERGVAPHDNRADMACSVSGDNFVVWGGKLSKSAELTGKNSGTPLIFNLRSKQWTVHVLRITSPVVSSFSKRDGLESGGIIIGIAAGVFVLICLIWCCFTPLRWSIQEKREKKRLEGLQQQTFQSNTQNSVPMELLPLSADKMEIQSIPVGVTYGQTPYIGPSPLSILGSQSSSQPYHFPQWTAGSSQVPTTMTTPAPPYLQPTTAFTTSSQNTHDPASVQLQYPIQHVPPEHAHTPPQHAHISPQNAHTQPNDAHTLPQHSHTPLRNPQTHEVDSPSSYSSPPPQVIRNPQDRNVSVSEEESPQDLARQIRVMQAELQRLQSKLDQ